ncbi:GDSL-type esterase/lipase family protein [Geminisphaera colitermitum]|uniref:GDSL-type esterase/lipase family protein n=1 Tax=Geminisphaera colitermitum TaxID=1148786 RepID=UPI000158CCE4|nr:GDSL-type esterase/lipase family protein [Geminisphaera colitermitum]
MKRSRMISTNLLPRLALVFTLLLTGSVALSAQASGDSAKPNPALVPATRNTWISTHNRLASAARQEGCDIMFLGDSITFGWKDNGKSIWEERYAPLKAVNFGLGGDRTENILWRLQNGALGGGINPKVVVLMIGTNNTGRDSAEQIAEGIAAIVQEIGKRAPKAKVLLLDIFPRSEKPDDVRRVKIDAINAIIAKLDDAQRVFFLPIGQKFLQPDGTLNSKAFKPDNLHLSPVGYKIWADAMDAKLSELLK